MLSSLLSQVRGTADTAQVCWSFVRLSLFVTLFFGTIGGPATYLISGLLVTIGALGSPLLFTLCALNPFIGFVYVLIECTKPFSPAHREQRYRTTRYPQPLPSINRADVDRNRTTRYPDSASKGIGCKYTDLMMDGLWTWENDYHTGAHIDFYDKMRAGTFAKSCRIGTHVDLGGYAEWDVFSELSSEDCTWQDLWHAKDLTVDGRKYTLVSMPGSHNRCALFAHGFCSGLLTFGESTVDTTHPLFKYHGWSRECGTPIPNLENIGSLLVDSLDDLTEYLSSRRSRRRRNMLNHVSVLDRSHAFVLIPHLAGKSFTDLIEAYLARYRNFALSLHQDSKGRYQKAPVWRSDGHVGDDLRCKLTFIGAKSDVKGRPPVERNNSFAPLGGSAIKLRQLENTGNFKAPLIKDLEPYAFNPVKCEAWTKNGYSEYHWPLSSPCHVHAIAMASLYFLRPSAELVAPLMMNMLWEEGKGKRSYIDWGVNPPAYKRDRDGLDTAKAMRFDVAAFCKNTNLRSTAPTYGEFVAMIEQLKLPLSYKGSCGIKLYKLKDSYHATFIGYEPTLTLSNELYLQLEFSATYAIMRSIYSNWGWSKIFAYYLNAVGYAQVTTFVKHTYYKPDLTNTSYVGPDSSFTCGYLNDAKELTFTSFKKFAAIAYTHLVKKPAVNDDIGSFSDSEDEPLQQSTYSLEDPQAVDPREVRTYVVKDRPLAAQVLTTDAIISISSSPDASVVSPPKTGLSLARDLLADISSSSGGASFHLSRSTAVVEENPCEPEVVDAAPRFYTKNMYDAVRLEKGVDCIGLPIHIRKFELNSEFYVLDFPRLRGHYQLYGNSYSYIDVRVERGQVSYNLVQSEGVAWNAIHHDLPYCCKQFCYGDEPTLAHPGLPFLTVQQVRRYAVGKQVSIIVFRVVRHSVHQPTIVDAQCYYRKPVWYDDVQERPASVGLFSKATIDAWASMWLLVGDNLAKVLSGNEQVFVEAQNFAKVIDATNEGCMDQNVVDTVRWIAKRYQEFQLHDTPKKKSLSPLVRWWETRRKYYSYLMRVSSNYSLSKMARFRPAQASCYLFNLWLYRHIHHLIAFKAVAFFFFQCYYNQSLGWMFIHVAFCCLSSVLASIICDWKSIYRRFVSLERSLSCNACCQVTTRCLYCDHSYLNAVTVNGWPSLVKFQDVESAISRKKWFPSLLPRSKLDEVYGKMYWPNFKKIRVGPWFTTINQYFDWTKLQPVKVSRSWRSSLMPECFKHFDPVTMEDTHLGGAWANFVRQGQPLRQPDKSYLSNIGLGVLNPALWKRALLTVKIPTFDEYVDGHVQSHKRTPYRKSYARFLATTIIRSEYTAFVKKGENGPYIDSRKNRNIANPDESILGVGGYMNHLIILATKEYIRLLFEYDPYFSTWSEGRRRSFFVHAMSPDELEQHIESIARTLSSSGQGVTLNSLDIRNFDAHRHRLLFEYIDFPYLREARILCARLPGWTKAHADSWTHYATRSDAKFKVYATNMLRKVKCYYKRMRVLLVTIWLRQTTFSGDPHKTTWGNTMCQSHLLIFSAFHTICPDGTRLLDHMNLLVAGDDLLVFCVTSYQPTLSKLLRELFPFDDTIAYEHGCGMPVKEHTVNERYGSFLSKRVDLKLVAGKVQDVVFSRPVRKLLETGVFSVNTNRDLIKVEYFNWMINQNLKAQIHDADVADRVFNLRSVLPMEPPGEKDQLLFQKDADFYWKYLAHKRKDHVGNKTHHWLMGQDADYRKLLCAADAVLILAAA